MTPARKQPDTSTYAGRFAVRLKTLREKAGLTVEEMAGALEISATSIYRWEADLRQPQISDLPKIADALSVKIRVLLPEK
jgi:transcriptional regulator with XRE-family HTH domain